MRSAPSTLLLLLIPALALGGVSCRRGQNKPKSVGTTPAATEQTEARPETGAKGRRAVEVSLERRAQDKLLLETVEPSSVQVFVVGIDGGTYRVMDPLLEGGQLPTFKKLIDKGTRAVLQSRQPIISPSIWTTVATGLTRGRHGITGFVRKVPDSEERKPLTTHDRRTHTTWTIANSFGLESGLSGWWVTWPPEPINGFVISDRVAQSRYKAWRAPGDSPLLSHPPDLAEKYKSVFCDPDDPPMDELLTLGAFNEAEQKEIREADRPLLHHAPSVVKTGWCEQRTYEEMMLKAVKEYGQPDLAHLLLIATDPISHTTWHWYEPDAYNGAVDAGEAKRLGTIVPGVYRHNDGILKRLMAETSRGTVYLVISDHGFQPSKRLPEQSTEVRAGAEKIQLDEAVTVGQSGVHELAGILIAAGGPIIDDAEFDTVPTVLDIAPTVLALMGLPVAEDMEGRVLTEMISPRFLKKHPIKTVASYEGLVERPAPMGAGEGLDSKRADYLKALGYIE
jgi:predicted AlkP superfamily phosphohydrolase/phosphomutase